MMKSFTSLVLVTALSGSVMAGVPMHSHGNDPAMMSCCKAAKDGDVPQASLAKICCAVNCPEPTPTSGTTTAMSSQPTIAAIHPAVSLPPIALSHPTMRLEETHFLSSSQPKYIRNLALLI